MTITDKPMRPSSLSSESVTGSRRQTRIALLLLSLRRQQTTIATASLSEFADAIQKSWHSFETLGLTLPSPQETQKARTAIQSLQVLTSPRANNTSAVICTNRQRVKELLPVMETVVKTENENLLNEKAAPKSVLDTFDLSDGTEKHTVTTQSDFRNRIVPPLAKAVESQPGGFTKAQSQELFSLIQEHIKQMEALTARGIHKRFSSDWKKFCALGLRLSSQETKEAEKVLAMLEFSLPMSKGMPEKDTLRCRNQTKAVYLRMEAILKSTCDAVPEARPNATFVPTKPVDADLATQNAQRLQNLLVEEQIRRENAEKDRANAEKEALQAVRAVNQTKDELRRVRTQLKEADEQAKSAQAKAQLAENRAQDSQNLVERLRQNPFPVLPLAEVEATLRNVFEKATLPPPPSETGILVAPPPLPAALFLFCRDLLALCAEAAEAERNPAAFWNPAPAKLDALVYGPLPSLTRLRAATMVAPPSDETATAWYRLVFTATRVQEGLHQRLTEKLSIVPIWAVRGDAFDPLRHESSDRDVVTTDKAELDNCVESLLRHGYTRHETVTRRAHVRRFRTVTGASSAENPRRA